MYDGDIPDAPGADAFVNRWIAATVSPALIAAIECSGASTHSSAVVRSWSPSVYQIENDRE